MNRLPRLSPKNILMLKGHSAGIGDLLRSSASWRALQDRFPESRLHLWFLTRNPLSASSQLISRHHLLASFRFTDKRRSQHGLWKRLWADARKVVSETEPQMVIDLEPNGFRTSLLTWRLGWWARAVTVGIGQVPFRGMFYKHSASSTYSYARRRGLTMPLEYSEKDFVALTALGIERNGTAIELRETPEARAFQEGLLAELSVYGTRPILGLNLGCGTPDAFRKRLDFDLLCGLTAELQRRHSFVLILTGAPYERDFNKEFLRRFQGPGPVVDLAGRTTLLEVAGAISACRLFISSDSGPYHMGVALRVPTLAVFNYPNPVHYHHHDWVQCHVAPDARALPKLLVAAEELWV